MGRNLGSPEGSLGGKPGLLLQPVSETPPLTVCGGKSPVWPPLEDRRGTGGVRGCMLGFADAEPWTSCGWKNQAELSVSDTLFQTDFISGDPVVPGAEQGMFFIWFMSWASSPPGEMGVR